VEEVSDALHQRFDERKGKRRLPTAGDRVSNKRRYGDVHREIGEGFRRQLAVWRDDLTKAGHRWLLVVRFLRCSIGAADWKRN
jgi:hypothetical protein